MSLSLKDTPVGNSTPTTPSTTSSSNPNNTWKLFVCNTFLVPNSYSTAATYTCERQPERAEALGRMILKHEADVVLLQEMWGAGYKALEKTLKSAGKEVEVDVASLKSDATSTTWTHDSNVKLTTFSNVEPYGKPQSDWKDDLKRLASQKDTAYGDRVARVCSHTVITDATKDSTHPLNRLKKWEMEKGNVTTSATTTAPTILRPQPLSYAVPYMMRSWWGIEFLDIVTQYFSKRGGLWHAHNVHTTELCGKGYVPLLSQLRDGSFAAGEPSEAGGSFMDANGKKVRPTTTANGKKAASKTTTTLNARVGKSNPTTKTQKVLNAVLPTYPRHHTYAATYFKQHNKSVMVIKVVKKKQHEKKSAESSVAAAPSFTNHPLLIFNTHLDPQNLGPRYRIIERQLVELKAFIADVVEREMRACAVHTSSGEINGQAATTTAIADKEELLSPAGGDEQQPSSKKSITNTTINAPFAAVIVGDFNIPKHLHLYPRLFEIMSNGEMSMELAPTEDGDESLGSQPELHREAKELERTSSGTASTLANDEENGGVLRKKGVNEKKGEISSTSSKIPHHSHCHYPRVIKTSIDLQVLLSQQSLAAHTYCANNVTVQHPEDEGRLDHIFGIRSVTVVTEERAADGVGEGDYERSGTRTITINLLPTHLSYERVLNDHKGGDALVSDHYPFVAEVVVGDTH